MLPTQIIGISNLKPVIIYVFKLLNIIVIKLKGNKQIDKKFILFQNLGFLNFIYLIEKSHLLLNLIFDLHGN